MTHPQTQDDEAEVKVMAFAIMVECFTAIPGEHPADTAARYATAALTALRNHEGRKG